MKGSLGAQLTLDVVAGEDVVAARGPVWDREASRQITRLFDLAGPLLVAVVGLLLAGEHMEGAFHRLLKARAGYTYRIPGETLVLVEVDRRRRRLGLAGEGQRKEHRQRQNHCAGAEAAWKPSGARQHERRT